MSDTTDRRPFLGVDVGGTFTDVVLADAEGRVHARKVLSTPDDPRDGACRGIEEILAASGTAPGDVSRLVHGTTRATNVILERKGPPIAFLTTTGFRHLLHLGREARVEGDRYDLLFEKVTPPVPPELTFEVDERVSGAGTVLTALTGAHAAEVAARVAAAAPVGVAICLINSYLDPTHEQLLAEAVRAALPGCYLAVSSDVWPEAREHDRAMTTVMSAYVGPVMADYLAGFEARVAELGITCPVEIMESSGGVMRAPLAARRPVYTVESGGAAGVTAAGFVGRTIGERAVISFDMGGTTAKAGVVRDGEPDITHDFQVGGKGSFGSIRAGTGFPIKTPVVDLAEVGAGGGSIAWVEGSTLRVGPRSAGSVPGPVCYGRGGTEPTVTDANLVLGYLDPDALSDGLHLDREAAAAAIERVVAPLGLDATAGAWAIHDLVNASMAGAIHVVTVQRGVDPRQFTLIGFGGAGPLHVAHLAESFEIPRTAVPWAAGVASAIGLCAADLTVHQVRAMAAPLDGADPDALTAAFEELEAQGRADLADPAPASPERRGAGGDTAPEPTFEVARTVDMRYRGQAYQLSVPAPEGRLGAEELSSLGKAFRERYRQAYGIDVDGPAEVVSLRTRVSRVVDKLAMAEVEPHAGDVADALLGVRDAYARAAGSGGSHPGVGALVPTPVYDWARLGAGAELAGPALVQGPDTTVVVPEGHGLVIDPYRNILIQGPAGRA